MAKAQHTPGAWRWFNYPDGRKLLSGANRAVIHCPDSPMHVEPADAALLAAAPNLKLAIESAPILSKYHGQRGFEVERFIEDYAAWGAACARVVASAEVQEP